MAGKNAACFYSWVAIMLDQAPTVIIHENVEQFGLDELKHWFSERFLGGSCKGPRQTVANMSRSAPANSAPQVTTGNDCGANGPYDGLEVLLCPSNLGWPCLRARQFVVMIDKQYIIGGSQDPLSAIRNFERELDLGNKLIQIFDRSNSLTFYD
eukprot:5050267-Alexandrium_andersonii.AAC.1